MKKRVRRQAGDYKLAGARVFACEPCGTVVRLGVAVSKAPPCCLCGTPGMIHVSIAEEVMS